MTPTRSLSVLVPFAAALFFVELGRNDLWSSHEARAAQNAQRMIDDGDWTLPRLYDGQVELQKPPGYYWLSAAIAELRGSTVDRLAVRLPAALSGFAVVLLVWGWLNLRGRPIAGLIAGVMLAGAIHFTSAARTGRIDMPLTLATASAVFLLISESSRRVLTGIAAGVALAAALLLKGPVGLALPFAAAGGWLAFSRSANWRHWNRLAWCGLLAVVLATPWFVWAYQATNGEFFRVFFIHHNLERATGESASLAVHPFWYYLPRFAIDFLPWTPLLVVALWQFRHRRGADSEARLGLVWLAAMIALLSLARFKRADYLLPAYPGAAIFLACCLERRWLVWNERLRKRASIAGLLILSSLLAGWWWFRNHEEPRMEAVRCQQPFASHIREIAPRPTTILLFRVESHLLAWHLGRPLHTLVEWSELDERLAGPGTHWFVTRAEFADECRAMVKSRRIVLAARSVDYSPAPPLRPLVLFRTSDIDEPDAWPTPPPKD